MNIALVAQGYPSDKGRGGIGSQTYAKANSLATLGHRVFVISRSSENKREELIKENVHIYLIPGLEQQLPEMTEAVQWLTHSFVIAAEIQSLLQKYQLDIIEFPEWGAEGYTYLLNRTDWNKIPVVIQLHGPMVMLANKIHWPHINSVFYKVGTHMEAICCQQADAVYSSSQCSAEWVSQHYHVTKKNIPVIHTGVDTNAFAPHTFAKAEKPTIVFTGRLVQNKGAEELVDAAIDLSKEINGLQLRLLGDGEEGFINKLKAKAQKANATALLHFLGFVRKEDLPGELSKAHVFAAPSYYEGGPGFVYLEAMACGLPVIGCSGSGVEEIITDEVNGILVQPRSVEELKVALRKILLNPELANQLGKAARDFTVSHADNTACILKLESFYKSVIEKYNPGHVIENLLVPS